MDIRRVVTSTDAEGRSYVASDTQLDNVISRRPGHASSVVWFTTLDADADSPAALDPSGAGGEPPATALTNGTVFRIMELAPGVAPRMHRTDSIDYVCVLSGEVCMQLDVGEVVLRTGDMLVQRATIHNWVNRTSEPCRLLVVLVGSGIAGAAEASAVGAS
jgi:quercetin dioxygenase-like cupin family protein